MGCIGRQCIIEVKFELAGVTEGAKVTAKPGDCTPTASTEQITRMIMTELDSDKAADDCVAPCDKCIETSKSTVKYTYFYGPWEIRQPSSDSGECISNVEGSCEVTQTTTYGQCVKTHSVRQRE